MFTQYDDGVPQLSSILNYSNFSGKKVAYLYEASKRM